MMRASKYLLVALTTLALLSACVSVKPTARITRGAGWYTVKKSDTLYSIAWRYGLDYKELARWNGIDIAAPIYPGQRLRLIDYGASPGVATRGKAESETTAGAGAVSNQGGSAAAAQAAAAGAEEQDPTAWQWPTQGVPLNTFDSRVLDRRGIAIGGKLGQPVQAVADGRVVYSGNGLAGYGNLIIIKHSDTYLSAYAYCQERLVQEGMSVKAGMTVAKMGRKDNAAKLYFELRRNGKPVDPMKYLPAR